MSITEGRGRWGTPPMTLLEHEASLATTTTAGGGFPPTSAALSDGGYVVVWFSQIASGLAQVYAQRYDAMGDKIGSEALIGGGAYIGEAVVAGLADGGYVVFYVARSFEFPTTTIAIYAQRFDAVGAFDGDRLLVARDTERFPFHNFVALSDLSVAGLNDGGFVLAWRFEYAPFPSFPYSTTTWVMPFDAQGVLLEQRPYPHSSDAVVAAGADGGFMLAYHDWSQSSAYPLPLPYVTVLRFDSAGTSIASINVHVAGSIASDTLALAGLSDGGYVLVGVSYSSEEGQVVFRYQFDASGAAVDASHIVSRTTSAVGPAVAALSDGGYVITWLTPSVDEPGQSVLLAQRFDGSGVSVGETIHVDTPGTNSPTQSFHAIGLADGGFAITWTAANQQGGMDIFTQSFEQARLGSNDADHLLGTDASDLIYGMAGADHIQGLDGNDKLDGGEGRDLMAGGPGNDRYAVDNVHDHVIEHAGEGQDTVYSAVSYELGPNLENLVLTGTADIDGAGNALDNVITGNAAANRLAGGRGADVLDGAGGRDVLVLDERGGPGHIDVLLNFVAGDDVIELDAHVFRGMAHKGTLSAEAFQVSAAALDASDRIIYDTGTGALKHDLDGTGEAAAVQIAALVGLAGTLSAENFVVA